MADLLDLDRALDAIPNVPESDYGVVGSLISACSAVVEKYCRRTFAQATYTDLLHGTGTQYLHVNNPPILKVIDVRTSLLPAVYVLYSDSTNQTQAATVDVTDTGVVLTRIYNTATTTSTFLFTDYPTFADLLAGINALGNGWHCTGSSQFSLWRTDDLNASQGSFSARNASVPLNVFWWSLPYFRVNETMGEIWSAAGFVPGYQNYRVQYQGGYSEIPDDIQQAVAELVQVCYAQRKLTPQMQSETLDKYSYTRGAMKGLDLLSPAAKLTLNNYRLMRIARWQ